MLSVAAKGPMAYEIESTSDRDGGWREPTCARAASDRARRERETGRARRGQRDADDGRAACMPAAIDLGARPAPAETGTAATIVIYHPTL